jgi:hypothetical protein
MSCDTGVETAPGSGAAEFTTWVVVAPSCVEPSAVVQLDVDRLPRDPDRIIQQHVHPTQLGGQHQQLPRQDRVPQRRLVVYSSEHDGLDPF